MTDAHPNKPRRARNLRQRRWLGFILIAFGFVYIVASSLVTSFLWLYAIAEGLHRHEGLVLHSGPLYPLTILLLSPGILCITRGRRHLIAAPSESPGLLDANAILYLRPFSSDAIGRPYHLPFMQLLLGGILCWRAHVIFWLVLTGVIRFEHVLAVAFRKVGRVVAIGAPTDRLPQRGVMRFYVEQWQSQVTSFAKQAKHVLLHIGQSEALRWELDMLVATVAPERFHLCINGPYHPQEFQLWPQSVVDARMRRQQAWSEFYRCCASAFPRGLPAEIGNGLFVGFDAEWVPQVVVAPRHRAFWFFPQRPLIPLRESVAGALAWFSWIVDPEPFYRRMLRAYTNYAVVTFVPAAIALVGIRLLAPSPTADAKFSTQHTTSSAATEAEHVAQRDPGLVAAIIGGHANELNSCFNATFGDEHALRRCGTRVRLEILASGSVARVSILDACPAQLSDCITRNMLTWRFGSSDQATVNIVPLELPASDDAY